MNIFNNAKWAIASAALFIVAGCTEQSASDPSADRAAESQSADAIYYNAVIWSGAGGLGDANAIATIGEKILAIGDQHDVFTAKNDETRMIDLGGRFLMPGFIDNHTHFMTGGFSLASVDLRDAKTPEEFSRRIGDYASTLPAGRWILEGNWDHELWGGELPTKEWIDQLTPNNPVFVMRLDGHMGLANSQALALAGVTEETPVPEGGEIILGADGKPSGVLKDTAMALVGRVVTERPDEEYDAAFLAAQSRALELGVTEAHDMGSVNWRNLETYRRAQENDLLKMRLYAFIDLGDWRRLRDYVAANGWGDDWLRWGGLKGFVDGSLGSTTAWFYEPYLDAPETNGLKLGDLGELKQNILDADAAGLHVTVHAIGDQANDWLLAAFSEASALATENARRRFRIEHAQHLSEDAIGKFTEIDVVASMHPYHAIDDGRWAEKRIGPERIRRTYAFRSLLDAGAELSFGTDWPVAPLNPLLGVYAAVTRRTTDGANPDGWVAQEKISVEEALRAYTAGSAHAGRNEETAGVLAEGMMADFIVLSGNLLTIDPVSIREVTVMRTIIGGEEMYRAQN